VSRVKFAAIGCSGMGRRHLHGLAKLRGTPYLNLDLVAVCDLSSTNAEAMADEARELFGLRPRPFTRIDDMVRQMPELQAANVVTDAATHLAVTAECFASGLHVLCEKPLGLTVRECRAIIDGARQAGRVLSVAENFRRDPMNRLVKALIDDGAIGRPRLMLETCIGGRDELVTTPWRHMKERGTVVIDSGIHNADLLRYFMGEVASVFGESRLHEKFRRRGGLGGPNRSDKDSWWRSHGALPAEIEATGEDAMYAQLHFRTGAVGQWVMDRAGHGLAQDRRAIYGSRGSIEAPGDRSGRPVKLHFDDGTVIADERILDYAPGYRLSPVATALFGDARPWSYDLSFNEVDQRLLALQLHELGDCILRGAMPEVTGEEALADVALAYAPIESGRLGRAVSLEEVGAGAPYQDEIDRLRAAGPARVVDEVATR
jgi:predicted dehydrogenase